MISLVLAALVVLVLFGRMAIPWLVTSLRFVLLGGLLWCVLSWAVPELVFDKAMIRSLHSGGSGRLPLWMEAWEMSLQNFPLGMGAQSWLTHTTLTSNYLSAQTLGHPHNMYLMWAAEYGWALIGLVAVLISVAVKRLLSLRRLMVSGMRGHASLVVAFTASSAAGLAHAGVSAVFLVPATMSVALLVLAIFWALSFPMVTTDSDSKTISGGAKRWGRPGALLAPFVLFFGVLWMQEVWRYHEAMREDLSVYVESPSAPLLPRFWLHGPQAVTAITFISGCCLSIFLVASRPPMPGIFASISTTSGSRSRTDLSASSPLLASPDTLIPAMSDSILEMPVRTRS